MTLGDHACPTAAALQPGTRGRRAGLSSHPRVIITEWVTHGIDLVAAREAVCSNGGERHRYRHGAISPVGSPPPRGSHLGRHAHHAGRRRPLGVAGGQRCMEVEPRGANLSRCHDFGMSAE
jgi:hypothetical protein